MIYTCRIEHLLGEDLAGVGVDYGDDSVVDGQSHRLAGVLPVDANDDAGSRLPDEHPRQSALTRVCRDGHIHGPRNHAVSVSMSPALSRRS